MSSQLLRPFLASRHPSFSLSFLQPTLGSHLEGILLRLETGFLINQLVLEQIWPPVSPSARLLPSLPPLASIRCFHHVQFQERSKSSPDSEPIHQSRCLCTFNTPFLIESNHSQPSSSFSLPSLQVFEPVATSPLDEKGHQEEKETMVIDRVTGAISLNRKSISLPQQKRRAKKGSPGSSRAHVLPFPPRFFFFFSSWQAQSGSS